MGVGPTLSGSSVPTPTPPVAPAESAEPLLEREREVEALAGLVRRASEGAGGVALLDAGAGLGKSRLLAEAARLASEQSVGFARARGRELDVDAPFGVVQQLLQPPLARAAPARREELLSGAAALAAPVLGLAAAPPAQPGGAGTAHGLYWLTAGLVAERPLVLAVDDAHWADAPSLRWLAYLARRLDGLSVAVLLATRPASQATLTPELIALASDPDVVRIEPQPLSSPAVDGIVNIALDEEPHADFSRAVHEASRGNPFYVRELLRSVVADGVHPSAAQAERVRALGPRAVVDAVAERLRRLPASAVELARAAAVLESSERVEPVRALAGLQEGTAASAWVDLARAGILEPDEPLRFVHPVVRAALYGDLVAPERDLLHRRAARVLSETGAPPDAVATHLLALAPAGDAQVVQTLRAAARLAGGRGAPRAAATYLRRALAEPPAPSSREEVLLELGTAQAAANDPGAAKTLSEVLERATDPGRRAAAALHLGQTYVWQDRVEEGLELLDDHGEELSITDPALALELESAVLAAARLDPATRPLVSERLRRHSPPADPESAADRALLAQLATEAVMAGESAQTTASLALLALSEGPPPVSPVTVWPVFLGAARALTAADGLDPAREWLTAQLELASARGDAMTFVVASCARSEVAHRMGDVAEAEADARSARAIMDDEGAPPFIVAVGIFILVDALLEIGDVAGARRAVTEAGVEGALLPNYTSNLLLLRLGRLHAAEGRWAQAVADLRECGRREELWDEPNPALVPWRSELALALNALGETGEARLLAREETRRARRFGAPRALGIALRAAGLVEGGAEGIELLGEAVRVLEGSPARLEHARASTDLGAALRRAKQWGAARPPLRFGIDQAERCGARALASRAREELAAAGGRPPGERREGVAALTASELRVARRAADGLANKEIAQGLFVTVKTVEKHLASAYRKLGTSRAELFVVLERVASPSDEAAPDAL